ncbi:hypothetical protein GCM10028833_25480 [Glycomyces tarimensis]
MYLGALSLSNWPSPDFARAKTPERNPFERRWRGRGHADKDIELCKYHKDVGDWRSPPWPSPLSAPAP